MIALRPHVAPNSRLKCPLSVVVFVFVFTSDFFVLYIFTQNESLSVFQTNTQAHTYIYVCILHMYMYVYVYIFFQSSINSFIHSLSHKHSFIFTSLLTICFELSLYLPSRSLPHPGAGISRVKRNRSMELPCIKIGRVTSLPEALLARGL